jgi:hypothetical protein
LRNAKEEGEGKMTLADKGNSFMLTVFFFRLFRDLGRLRTLGRYLIVPLLLVLLVLVVVLVLVVLLL